MKILAHKQKLIDLLGDCENAAILDYGCGKGDFIQLLISRDKKPSCIIAADSSTTMIKSIQDTFAGAINHGIVTPRLTHTPTELKNIQFDKIICHNVLECIDDKLTFINSFKSLLKPNAIFILSHHDFDSAIYNSAYEQLSRDLIHHFADTKQHWQQYSDGQIGRKMSGLINNSVFREYAEHSTWRLVDTAFKPSSYGYLMAHMLIEIGKSQFKDTELKMWLDDLINKSLHNEFYFAIDLVVSKITMKQINR